MRKQLLPRKGENCLSQADPEGPGLASGSRKQRAWDQCSLLCCGEASRNAKELATEVTTRKSVLRPWTSQCCARSWYLSSAYWAPSPDYYHRQPHSRLDKPEKTTSRDNHRTPGLQGSNLNKRYLKPPTLFQRFWIALSEPRNTTSAFLGPRSSVPSSEGQPPTRFGRNSRAAAAIPREGEVGIY